jgi:glucose/arabinose dehydrogenase
MSSRRERILFVLLILAVLCACAGYYIYLHQSVKPDSQSHPETTAEGKLVPELEHQVMLDELSNVWDIGFLPDATLVFTEREGTISKLDNGQKVVIHRVANVYARGEGGVLGMVVDPDFSHNRFIYACYNTADDIRVSRWKINTDATTLDEQVDIITGMPVNTKTFPGRHSGCRPRFDGSGTLWVATGDVAGGSNPQDPQSLGGKILRVNRGGQSVDGNLGEPFDNRIFSYGHRNVQGLALLPEQKNGLFGYSVEHGPGKDDEINPLQTGNFGWNPIPEYNEKVAMTDKKAYPDAVEALWSSGESTIAPSGAVIIKGEKWKAYEGRLAVAVLKEQHVRLFKFGLDMRTILDEREVLRGEFGRVRSVVMGPEDDLFLSTDNGRAFDKIIRITPR